MPFLYRWTVWYFVLLRCLTVLAYFQPASFRLLCPQQLSSHFDFLVIGGGSGGIAAARRAAGYGAKVAVIESSRVGGTCVNAGCVPKKIMFNAANIAESLHDAEQFGFEVDQNSMKFNWDKLTMTRSSYIAKLNDIYNKNLASSGVRVMKGHGSFVGPNTVRVRRQSASAAPPEQTSAPCTAKEVDIPRSTQDKEEKEEAEEEEEIVTADHILIAVGSRPALPSPQELRGVQHCLSSDGFFALQRQPAAVAVVGAGYIGVELSGVLQALGTQTTLLHRERRMLGPHFDALVVETLEAEMLRRGVTYLPNQQAVEVTKSGASGKLHVRTAAGDVFGPFDEVGTACFILPCNVAPLLCGGKVLRV
jgi:glutathione reductase (NADPH)